MNTFIVILIILWLVAIIFRFVNRKHGEDKKTNKKGKREYNIFRRLKLLSLPQKIFIVTVALVDLLVILLSNQNYYFIFLKPTSFIFPTFLALIAIFVLLKGLKLVKFWGPIIAVLVLLLLVPFAFIYLIVDLSNSYETVESPKGENIVIIEHRDATLGETHHFYNFYIKTNFLGLMKQLNSEQLQIITNRTQADNLEVLGVDNAKWVDSEYVIFRSPYAVTKLKLNY